VGCGADPAERASSASDASALLRSTFANAGQLKSAAIDLQVARAGDHAHLQGPVVAGKRGELPKFALSGDVTTAGKTEHDGVTWTGSRGFVTVKGETYEVPSAMVQLVAAGYQQALQQGPLMGLDASRWIKDPRNAGLATVGGVSTVKITGPADMTQVAADLDKLGQGLPGVGGLGSGGREALDNVKNATVTVYTGADVQSAPSVFDLTLTRVGEDQAIPAPADARPFSELMAQFKGGGIGLGAGLQDDGAPRAGAGTP
jgi:hypothetical protein